MNNINYSTIDGSLPSSVDIYLEDISEQIDLLNKIEVGFLFFLGCLFGLLFMWILWSRFK